MTEEYKSLGSKTYWMFMSQRSDLSWIFLVLSVLLSIGRTFAPLPYSRYIGVAAVSAFVVFFIALAYAALAGWIIYKSHGYLLADDALRIKQGVLTRQEIAIPYRQIQNIDIERTLSQRMMGLSRLIILTAGHEDQGKSESEGILPAMDKRLADELQQELIKRTNVEKVVEEPNTDQK